MNRPSSSNTRGLSRDDQKQERNTFGWKPEQYSTPGNKVGNSQSAYQRSTPQSPNGYSSNVQKSTIQKSILPISRNAKREGSSFPSSPNLTPITKELCHHAKRDKSSISTPPHSIESRRSPSSPNLINSRSIHSTPIKMNKITTQLQSPSKQNKTSVITSPEVSIKKSTTNPSVSKQEEEDVLSQELKEKLMSKEYIGLTIKPESCALEQCLQPLQEMEDLCSEGAIMKVKNPTTKLEERNLEIDAIVENAHSVLLRVISIFKECIQQCKEIERNYICYSLCIKHNKEVDEKSIINLQQQNSNIIDIVASLNSTYLTLKDTLSDLTTETSEYESIRQSNKESITALSIKVQELTQSVESVREIMNQLRHKKEELTEKVNQLKEEQKQHEKIVHNKWEPVIASLEQDCMVINRDRQMVEFNQKGEETTFETKIKQCSYEEEESRKKEEMVCHANQEITERLMNLREKKKELDQELIEKEKERQEKEMKVQQNEKQKIYILELIQKKQETSEDEIKQLNKASNDYQEEYKQNCLQVTQYENDIKTLNQEIEQEKSTVKELEDKKKNLIPEVNEKTVQVNSLRQEVEILKSKVNQCEITIKDQNHHLVQLNNDVSKQDDLYNSDKKEKQRLLDEQQYLFDHSAELWEEEKKQKQERIAFLKQENQRYEEENSHYEIKVKELHESTTAEEQSYLANVHSYQEEQQQLINQCQEREKKRQQLEQNIAIIEELEQRASEGEMIRRRLHNTLQELRGNLRVIARVRPLLTTDKTLSMESAVWCNDDTSVSVRYKNKIQCFHFDGCFDASSTQTEVFEEVENFVQSALDGYNVCLFTYGQTGSGKTYTMQGIGEEEERGIVPRSIEKIIDEIERLKDLGWEYDLSVSYIEIYREMIRDLLIRNSSKLEVKLDINGHPYIPNLKKLRVESKRQIHSLMEIASACRAVGATDMNDTSSRSHGIFTLYLSGKNSRKNLIVEGRLNLVDLAGSERLDKSHSTGEALEEAKFINRSLSSLSNVFINIRNNASHVNFRDSKLTLLLKDCLSREGKTLMFVNLSPVAESAQESICSLNFAATASQCKQGQAKRKIIQNK